MSVKVKIPRVFERFVQSSGDRYLTTTPSAASVSGIKQNKQ